MAKTGTGIRPENRCVAARKKDGKRCGAARVVLKDINTDRYVRYRVCLGHLTKAVGHKKMLERHGIDLNGRPGRGGRPKMPTAIELLRQKVEEEYGLDGVLEPFFKALEAQKAMVVGNGPKARIELVDDPDLQLKAAQALMDRVYGRPKQQTELTGSGGGPIAVDIPDDTERQMQVARMLALTGALDEVVIHSENGNGHTNGNGNGAHAD